GNTVLTGHVWDSWNQPGPFSKLRTLRYGDQFTIQAWGQTYTYEVRENRFMFPKQVNKVFQHQELDWVTLVTCEFYNPFKDNYVFRRAVSAVLISVD
ncbi:MAG: sortase, partial [Anaerolineae bacterium]|nr:sortase [Anaerolineae bacterium]